MTTDTNKTETISDHFTTDNIWLASYIWAEGADFVTTEEKSPGSFIFIFHDRAKCQLLADQYTSGGSLDNVLIFLQNKNYLLQRIKPKK